MWQYLTETYDTSLVAMDGYLTERGTEGWEAVGLVRVHDDQHGDVQVLVLFKRPFGASETTGGPSGG